MALYELILAGDEDAVVPPIFLYEACNTVMQAIRRKRITEKTAEVYLRKIFDFPVEVDAVQEMPEVVLLATKHKLTMYDASYLELSKRKKLPIATFDKELAAAAKKEKLPSVC